MAVGGKFGFEVLHKDLRTNARRGVLHTAHGDVPTELLKDYYRRANRAIRAAGMPARAASCAG